MVVLDGFYLTCGRRRVIRPVPISHGTHYHHNTCLSYGHYVNPRCILIHIRGEGGHDGREETVRPAMIVWSIRQLRSSGRHKNTLLFVRRVL